MNKAITDGLVLMPPPFSAGLNLWSREDGTVGSGSYQGQANAAFVPADQDFGGCLELQKTQSVQKLRCFPADPVPAGAVSAGDGAGEGDLGQPAHGADRGLCRRTPRAANVAAAVQTGPEVTLTTYGAGGDGQRDPRLGQPDRAATWSGARRRSMGIWGWT